jgi:hypothetical protein
MRDGGSDAMSALDITTLVLAIIGVVAAGASLIWQVVSWRLTGPVVRVEIGTAIPVMAGQLGPDMVYVKAINIGRAPVEVTGWGFRLPDGRTIVGVDEHGAGPTGSFTLAGGHSEGWYMYPTTIMGGREAASGVPIALRGMVRLGTGREILSKKAFTIQTAARRG